ncbi:hypothetical protein [Agrobacterium tumefaciens]|uniref:hypothetical protein n=1 Tax=Agrobacterium tumefaciens TaxID=358 RepID=UPI0021CF4D42|nr:hypothetical protein [Agrobacterium tumefaciens]UXS01113.1 hypothetical protein FY156_06210 [Agrobacterium tumefaciens]
MNLRTLKKLSKRAAALLPLLGDKRQQFPSERGDNYHGNLITARKHWDRRRCHPKCEPRSDYLTKRGAEILHWTKAGAPVLIKPPIHPRKGTVMVGAVSGYYEPEWDEESAWSALDNLVRDHFTDWERIQQENVALGSALTRDLSTPSKILSAARDMIAELGRAA